MSSPELLAAQQAVRANAEQIEAANGQLRSASAEVGASGNQIENGAKSLEEVSSGVNGIQEGIRGVLTQLMGLKTAAETAKTTIQGAGDDFAKASGPAQEAVTSAGAAANGISSSTNNGTVPGTADLNSAAAGFNKSVEDVQSLILAGMNVEPLLSEPSGVIEDITGIGGRLEAIVTELGTLMTRASGAAGEVRKGNAAGEQIKLSVEQTVITGSNLSQQVAGFTVSGNAG